MPDGAQTDDACPNCGSPAVRPLRAMEHESCGAIKPVSAFVTDDGVVCPECETACEDVEYVARGSPSTCAKCGYNFAGGERPDAEDAGEADGTDDRLASVRDRIAAADQSARQSRWPRRVLVVAVLFLAVSVSAVGVFGTAAVTDRADGSANSTATDYRTIVVFRNDDVQPNYRSDQMRAVDRVFVEEGVPVTQGVVPAIGDERLDPEGEFCRYLRTQMRQHPNTFEYALHGYTHERRSEFHGGSEFGGVAPDRQRELLAEGTRALESCVDRTPATFVPPFDTYDDETASALAARNYTVVSGGGWFAAEYYDETGPFEDGGVVHLPNAQSFVKNWTTNEFHDQRHLERQFDEAYRNGEVYVQMLHYPTFTDEAKRDRLRGLIHHMQSKEDVAFMTVGEFARKYRDGRLTRTAEGWRVEATGDDSEPASQRVADAGRHLWERLTSHSMPGAR
ncbi:DUF2334 domain-containing protein [Halorussus halobius]|uniref:DUF2334 domain-containing protein n=1 Tax=Halorussus halobius TaxID=1710537 RepID=UPI00109211FC|nr:DUF2334 domain-containing protein [Halorussus halobius]